MSTDHKTDPEDIASKELSRHLVAANRLIAEVGADNLIHAQGSFWMWKATGVWRRVEDLEIKQLVQRGETGDKRLSSAFVNGVVQLVQNEVYRPGHQFDLDRRGINCANGELHWNGQDWELRPHIRESYRTTQLPVDYDSAALAPRFTNFLDEIFRDDPDHVEKAKIALEAIGYSLLASCEYEKFFLLIGSGANGKSVLMDVVGAVVGQAQVCAVQPSQFGNKFQRAHLQGKLVNLVTEIAAGYELADAELKAIVSGELTTAEHKSKPPFDFYPFATCWFGTNHMPHTRDFSEAIFRRVIILEFDRTFTADEQDLKLKEKLKAELPGILNLATSALAKMLQRGSFTSATSCETAKTEWKYEADQVAQFVQEKCESVSDHKETSADIYNAYKAWAVDIGIQRTFDKKTFTTRLCRYGATAGKSSGGERVVWGLRLRSKRT